jgi:hypothetical protein
MEHLTEKEKKRTEKLSVRGFNHFSVCADIIVGRHIIEFIHLQGETEEYLEEREKNERASFMRF